MLHPHEPKHRTRIMALSLSILILFANRTLAMLCHHSQTKFPQAGCLGSLPSLSVAQRMKRCTTAHKNNRIDGLANLSRVVEAFKGLGREHLQSGIGVVVLEREVAFLKESAVL